MHAASAKRCKRLSSPLGRGLASISSAPGWSFAPVSSRLDVVKLVTGDVRLYDIILPGGGMDSRLVNRSCVTDSEGVSSDETCPAISTAVVTKTISVICNVGFLMLLM